ncbi:YggS family pyridoxal phosphate-dependent enzyme [Ralstonia pseudosolanacearum]|uniref:Pyridoxal phosphate homeostasis protein n=1 Tax=Ralstonia solanacearum TaxID=305 RepID=A0AA92JZC1_RALSL|nr:YggS family pyridoxal phosphate-dependent enzyme [Ralstonia pseudosolanacearum]QOK90749.1 YggS family pyridoxal phosphate-dependent enzyme [Ralstonia pseudosolanacearum]QOK95674.1 YggS family pyridoxal phosphate-dependent enzyme [Ralstonia pseudosolanacearum]UWD91706.1 YggS family pyridoxal phosphate-dependent enzyme [Ralstonia pseudosolanacearum]CAH0439828.1 Pyridoxal phosphate homeostasis protein [Ralstonia pseudosolanacearum]
MSVIAANLQAVRQRITTACTLASRDPASVTLLAVSKTFDADAVRAAHAAGQRLFGENYVQEGTAKTSALTDLRNGPEAIAWHFIGPLQSNKTRAVAEHFDWVHSIDRLKIAERLSAQRPATLPPLQVCLEINISRQTSKHGVPPDLDEVLPLARAVAALPRLRLRGLMAVPEPADDPAARRAPFATLRDLADRLRAAGLPVDTLSMGMSADLEDAIAEGATIVRVGSAIFGARQYAHAPA